MRTGHLGRSIFIYRKVADGLNMYHIAFEFEVPARLHKNPRAPIIHRRVLDFLNNSLSGVQLLHKSGNERVLEPTQLPWFSMSGDEYMWYSSRWFLHYGWTGHDTLSDYFDMYPFRSWTAELLNDLFSRCAKAFDWVMFPWGDIECYEMVAFVSGCERTWRHFVDTSPFVYPNDVVVSVQKFGALVSTYSSISSFGDSCRIAELSRTDDTLHRLWDVFCQRVPTIVASEQPEHSNWSVVGRTAIEHAEGELLMFRPRDKNSFLYLNKLRSEPTAFVFPDSMDAEDIHRVVALLADESQFSDLCFVRDVFECTPWMFSYDHAFGDVIGTPLLWVRDGIPLRSLEALPYWRNGDDRFACGFAV